jgi:predicted metal-dependent peptidase
MHDLNRKIARSKVRLMLDKLSKGWGFYASILYQMPMVVKNDISTMATDGTSIFYNEEFTDALTEPQLDGVKVHEALHRVLKHHLRQGKRDHQLWNIACDYAINPIILASDLVLPDGALVDARFKDMSAEKIYDILQSESGDDPQGGDGNSGNGSGVRQGQSWGNVNAPQGMSEDQVKQEEATIDAQTMMAVSSIKNRGEIPSSIKDIIKAMERSQIDWVDVLRRFVGGDQPQDYSYRRPNRRQWYLNEVITPTSNMVGCGHVVVAIDTSGSVSNKELSYFLGELNEITKKCGADSVTVIQCDADIQDVKRYEKGEDIEKFSVVGRGGTCVMPVFNYIDKENIKVDNFIYFTDMGIFDYPKSDVGYPILWVSSDIRGKDAPIGQTTYLKVA